MNPNEAMNKLPTRHRFPATNPSLRVVILGVLLVASVGCTDSAGTSPALDGGASGSVDASGGNGSGGGGDSGDGTGEENAGDDGSVWGRVRSVDGEPIYGAFVAADGSQTATDEDGVFRLEHISAGTVLLKGSRPRFASTWTRVEVVSGETSFVQLFLAPQAPVQIEQGTDGAGFQFDFDRR